MNKIIRKNEQNDDAVLVNLRSALRGRVAVFIDAANLEKSVQAIGFTPPRHVKRGMVWRAAVDTWHVDYRKLHQFFAKHIKLVSMSFYTARFGTASHDGFLTFLKHLGYRVQVKPVKTIVGRGRTITCAQCGFKTKIPDERKANFDVEISIDAVTWERHFDTFVLFSGDSDFVYLLQRLKRLGKHIIVISRRGHVADELRTSPDVDFYIDYWKLRTYFLRKKP